MKRDIKELVHNMTLEEKAGMCSGMDAWHLKSVDRLGIPAVMVSDGPHGLRKQVDETDHLGINGSIEAVCFPSSCATACSFDRDLLRELGEALGNECQAEDVSILLGPGVNIKRSPLCGRNFEYFSEDPYLTGQLAKHYIIGVQSQGVGTAIKHFAANNQEYHRMTGSSEVNEQALREIYFAAFETPIKEAHPETVMCSYNKINGTYSSENPWLLKDVLRNEWGFAGYVMSDWGAVNDRVKGLKAGLELEMPSSQGVTDLEIVQAVKEGTLDEAILDQAVEKILEAIFRYEESRKTVSWNKEEDHKLAERIERESAVLLKNDGALPLSKEKEVAFVGLFAEKPRFQGGGSSHINAFKVDNALEAASAFANVTYAQGYTVESDTIVESLVSEATEKAARAEAAVIFAGLPDSFESEGFDRSHMRLPQCQDHLIREVCKVQPNTIVVLHNGSPVEMPWADQVKGILEMYLGGESVGKAEAALLYGEANPCGKLAETIPYQLEDNPSYLNFPGDGEKVCYQEGIFVGYRYYDKKKMKVRFPFGHGLSYTSFEYSGLSLDKNSMKDSETLTVTVKVKNTGDMAGREVIQLYVSNQMGMKQRPVRELKNFEKISLDPGEKKTVTMTLDRRSFAEYNTKLHDWYVPGGTYNIEIGRSSREIAISDSVEIESTVSLPLSVEPNTLVEELLKNEKTKTVLDRLFKKMQKMMGASQEASGGAETKSGENAMSAETVMMIVSGMPLKNVAAMLGLDKNQINLLIRELNEASKQSI